MIGRIFGWFLISLAILTASAEAVMALGTGSYEGLAAGEVWTLLAGHTPFSDGVDPDRGLLAALGAWMMNLPAWVVMGPLGLAFLVTFRKRPKRLMFRGAHSSFG